jgi:hypothetical protein
MLMALPLRALLLRRLVYADLVRLAPRAGYGRPALAFERAHESANGVRLPASSWTLLGEAPEWQKLYDRRESYKVGTVPTGGLFLTAGADVQKDRIEVEITAWGRGKESWSVDYRVFEGDTSRPQVWEKLTGLLNESFSTGSGLELQILQLAVDSGFATIDVYQWARRHGGRVLVIKGDSRTPALIGSAAPVEVGPACASGRSIPAWPRKSCTGGCDRIAQQMRTWRRGFRSLLGI